ncbi:hypothetical protein O4H52_03035 [Sphingomonadaceae bacterium G21617-S1]|nr:hypothetical protein [Sphingomonadaceae bacterium G21617-S1]
MKKLFAAIVAATLSVALVAQTAQVLPQLGLDKTGNPRRVTVYDPTKAGADKMVPIGSLDAGNVFTPAFVSGSNIKTVGGVSLLGSGDIGTLGVAYGGTGVTSSTGTGATVRSNSPALVTPALGTPSAAVLTNATGLPLTSGVSGTLPVGNGGTGVTSATGSGSVVLSDSPVLVSPALGTPASGVATNLTGTASGLTAGMVTTNANLTGVITSIGNATSIASQTGTGTKFVVDTSPTLVTPNIGTPSAAVLTNATGLPLTSGVTGTLPVANGGTGVTSATGTGSVVLSNAPVLVAPALGTPASGVATNLTGTASGLTAGTVTTNANLTGVITSIGNATSIASQTGSGTKFVVDTSPTLVTPNLGTPSAAVLTNATGLPLTSGVSGTLPVANGGTGVTSATGTGSVVLNTNPSLSGVTLASGTIAATPVSATDIANKSYVDGAINGLSVKNSVDIATATALPANSYSNGASGVGATLTASATGALTVDGQTAALNDRILVKNESAGSRNGIYLVTTAGAPGVAYVLTRGTDSDAGSELKGAFTFVEKGTVNASTGWANTNGSTITVGSTAVTFSQFSGAGTYLAGTGLNLTGSSFSLADTTVTPAGYTLGSFTVDAQGRLTAASSAATTGSGSVVLATSPTLVSPALGTPASGVATNLTGTASGLTAGTVTTNANLTGVITSIGNATSIASQTGSGTKFVVDTSPTLVTPNLGTPSAAVLTNATGLPLTSGVTGTLAVANGGTGVTSSTGSGSNVLSTSPTLVTPALGTPSAAVLTNATGLPLTTGVTGTLPTANGGTGLGGATPYTANGLFYASGAGTMATGSALSFDGTNFATTGRATAASFVPSSATVPTNGMFLTAANTLGWSTNSVQHLSLSPTGSLGLDAVSLTGFNLRVSKNITGAAESSGVRVDGQVQSDVSFPILFKTQFNVASGTTVSIGTHYLATQGTNSGTVGTVRGFTVDPLTAGTTIQGFYSDIAAASGRWNFYANGTANNYLGGRLGMGTTALTAVNLYNALPITGSASSFGNLVNSVVQSDVTAAAYGYKSILGTAAASFTDALMIHYGAEQSTLGAGSTVQTQIAFRAEPTLIGASFNVGLQLENTAAVTSGKIAYGIVNNVNVATGGGTTWGYYGQGTAPNYFAGDMQFDKTVTAGGTTGARTINKNAGSVNFAAAATSLVVTNDRVTANSIIMCTVAANDNTLKSVACVPGSGSFTMVGNAAANAETRVAFLVVN